ncbi:hypothetical protein GGF32_008315 [Allomyces javanicus]|nr:hypothetical protein GGF32_008315 [Allomyces javanicus]
MLDALLAFEYTEWGNPAADRTIYDVMLGYCPYTNVTARARPITLESVSPRRSRTVSHQRHESGKVGLDLPREVLVVRRAQSLGPAVAPAVKIIAREC